MPLLNDSITPCHDFWVQVIIFHLINCIRSILMVCSMSQTFCRAHCCTKPTITTKRRINGVLSKLSPDRRPIRSFYFLSIFRSWFRSNIDTIHRTSDSTLVTRNTILNVIKKTGTATFRQNFSNFRILNGRRFYVIDMPNRNA